MEQTERLTRLLRLLMSDSAGLTARQLAADLEVSEVTVKRDIRTLRHRFNAPLEYQQRIGYRLIRDASTIDTFMLPGMWFDSEEAYAMLGLYNIVADLGISVFGDAEQSFKGLCKQARLGSGRRMFGWDRKIRVDMPDLPAVSRLIFDPLMAALAEHRAVRLHFRDQAKPSVDVSPQRVVLTTRHWRLDAVEAQNHQAMQIAVHEIDNVDRSACEYRFLSSNELIVAFGDIASPRERATPEEGLARIEQLGLRALRVDGKPSSPGTRK